MYCTYYVYVSFNQTLLYDDDFSPYKFGHAFRKKKSNVEEFVSLYFNAETDI